ncbi:MAG: hypothetical protein HOW73_40695 [Polyangiaceae bacterium]|nr:hypothetical protein [Polyangiaceae bacterium]
MSGSVITLGCSQPAVPAHERTDVATSSTATTASASSSSSAEAAPPADFVHPMLAMPLSRYPASIVSIRRDTEYARRDVLTAVCGRLNIERDVLESMPNGEARSVARALSRPDDGRAALRCRREMESSLPADFVARSVGFSLPGQSEERVYFVTLPIRELPAATSDAGDASKLTGLPGARCFAGIGNAGTSCGDLSDVIAKWPESDMWIFGRARGVRLVAETSKSGKPPHPRAGWTNRLVEKGKDLELSSISFDCNVVWGLTESVFQQTLVGAVAVLSGRNAQGDREQRIVTDDEGDAQRIEAKLAANRAAELDRKAPVADASCSECAPRLARAYVDWLRARPAQERRSREASSIERTGKVVVVRWPDLEDDAYDRATRALDAARDEQRKALKVIVDAWIDDGKVPKPDAFAPIAGPKFVKALRDELR